MQIKYKYGGYYNINSLYIICFEFIIKLICLHYITWTLSTSMEVIIILIYFRLHYITLHILYMK